MKRLILAGLLLSGAASFAHAETLFSVKDKGGAVLLAVNSPPVRMAGLPNPLTPFTPPKKAVAGALIPAATNVATTIQTVTLDDLKNALADSNGAVPAPGVVQPAPYNAAVTGGDVRHGNCWAALIDFVGKIQAQSLIPNQAGLATLQQKIFDDQQLAGKPLLPDYVVTNCALTFNDAQMNLVQVVNWLGLKAITLPKIP